MEITANFISIVKSNAPHSSIRLVLLNHVQALALWADQGVKQRTLILDYCFRAYYEEMNSLTVPVVREAYESDAGPDALILAAEIDRACAD